MQHELASDRGRPLARRSGDRAHGRGRQPFAVHVVQDGERAHQAIVAGRREPVAETQQCPRARDQPRGVALPDRRRQARAAGDSRCRVQARRVASAPVPEVPR